MTVPDGTAQDVLDWVGDDPARAQEALDAENAGQGRTTLIAKLETIAARDAAQEDAAVTETTTSDPQSLDEPEAEVELAPAPEPPTGEDLSVDLADHATHVGPANVVTPDVSKPDDSYDLAAQEALDDPDTDEAPIDAAPVEYFQLASTNGVVVLRFDGHAVVLDANQAAALSKDLRRALAGVTY